MNTSVNYKGYILQESTDKGSTLIFKDGDLVAGSASDVGESNIGLDNSIIKAKINIDNGVPSPTKAGMTIQQIAKMYVDAGLSNWAKFL